MSEAHVAKFFEMVANDPALRARLGPLQVSDEARARISVGIAVKEAQANGLQVTEEEVYGWMQRESAHAAELTDAQLDAVAGGVVATTNDDAPGTDGASSTTSTTTSTTNSKPTRRVPRWK